MLALLVVVLAAVSTWWWVHRADRKMRMQLLQDARIAASSVNLERISGLTGTRADLSSPDYRRLKKQFTKTRTAIADCRFLYLMGQKPDGRVFFYSDSLPSDSPDYAPPGLIYEEVPAAYLRVFDTKQAKTVGPVTDRWGTLITALVPLLDPETGALLAVLGMDVDAGDWYWGVTRRSALPVGLALLALLIGINFQQARHNRILRRSENALRRERDYSSSIITRSPAMICGVAADGTLTFINPAGERATGYAADEIVGHNWWKTVFPGRAYQQVTQFFRDLEENGVRDYEMTLTGRSGQERIISWNWIRRTDENGRFTELIGFGNDVTPRKQAEAALRESESRLRAILQATPDPMIVYDETHTPRYVNPAFTHVFGLTLETLQETGFPCEGDDNVEDLPAKIREINHTGGPLKFETRLTTGGGNVLEILVSAALIAGDNGTPQGMVVNLADISRIKQLENQLQRARRMEAIGTLAGGIAHDFNNLLSGIQGHVSLMRSALPSEHRSADSLNQIAQHVEKGAGLTRQLLGFAKEGKYEVQPTNLNTLIEAENQLFSRTCKDVILHTRCAPDLRAVEVDRSQMRQVLMNLYVNARQAMPGGGDLYVETKNVTLDAEAVALHGAAAGAYVRLSVADTGEGMDKNTLDKIFDPFFTTKSIGQGTGLGLASVYGIVQNHSGFIQADSEPGRWTMFTIYLPASDREPADDQTPSAPEKTMQKGVETILLVDDEKPILDVNRELLEALGYTVLTAQSGNAAVALYAEKKNTVDLVILDLIMPGMSGAETFEALKRENPAVRVLLFSGYSLGSQARELLRRGCGGFLQKPFHMDALSEKIREILDQPDTFPENSA
ncbi:MAG: PAS domain-containing hybrid sensor histidine kinase/response regulator [Thermodesulfobacteriota bacterium]